MNLAELNRIILMIMNHDYVRERAEKDFEIKIEDRLIFVKHKEENIKFIIEESGVFSSDIRFSEKFKL